MLGVDLLFDEQDDGIEVDAEQGDDEDGGKVQRHVEIGIGLELEIAEALLRGDIFAKNGANDRQGQSEL